MPEKALALPFEANEIKEIAVKEFRKRLDACTPLMGMKEYSAFSIGFNIPIRLRRAGESGFEGKETLVWGQTEGGAIHDAPEPTDEEIVASIEPSSPEGRFDSKEPNVERMERGMPVTVETSDGRGGKSRKKVLMEKK